MVKKIFSLEEYRQYRGIFLFFSLFCPLLIDMKLFFIFLIYHGLTFVYSCPPFRLKRFFGVASLLSSLASLLFLLAGFLLMAEKQSLENFPWKMVIFLFFSCFLLIPLKDLKDVAGDRKMGVWTLPVLVGEQAARLILATLFLINYLFSVYFFREEALFLPALFFATGTFWLIVSKKITARFLPGWAIVLASGYFLFLLKMFLVS